MYRIGSMCLIKDYKDNTGLRGAFGEIVDMEIQEDDMYMTYPLWVKILSGENKGTVHGFNYDEIAVGVDYFRTMAPAMAAAR